MNRYLYRVAVIWLIICFLIICFRAVTYNPPADLLGDVSIDCGSKGGKNGGEWVEDAHTQVKGSSTISSVVSKCLLADPIPYRNARLTRSTFSYTFRTKPGQKFIRLHFNPTAYKGFQRLNDLFTVEAGSFVLLRNFSASLTADALGLRSFTKEFCVYVRESQRLELVFSSQSSDTYAFVNGIEIRSVPSPHSYLHGIGIGENTALEMVQRENVKQDSISTSDDSSYISGLWGTHPKEQLTEIDNVKWKIPVYAGFRYLVRLHFSAQGIKMGKTEDVILKVLGKETAADIVIERDKNDIQRYWDYLVLMTGCKEEKRVLMIYLPSNDRFPNGKLPIRGFEIFKISDQENSLASPNPVPPALGSPYWTVGSIFLVLGHRNAIATVSLIVIAVLSSIVFKLREIWEANRTEEKNKPSRKAQRFCRCFSLVEIRSATRDFSPELLIGKGGFGNVYKGIMRDGEETIAIKRLKPSSKQGKTEFLTEIETLSKLQHINLVSLIGYCNEPGEMILAYEYMAGGALSEHLYNFKTNKTLSSSLTWKQCLSVCIGAGRALDYLHTGCEIIHGDFKASNILLDDNFMAKLSDFGTAKHENEKNVESQDSAYVKGTPGYFDPCYLSKRELTRNSDTYAFGVVLLEVLCRRPALLQRAAQEEQNLAKWATNKISKGEVDQIVSPCLRDNISQDSLNAFVKICERCLNDEPQNRPTMGDVVVQLESVLKQHESTENITQNDSTSVADDIFPIDDAAITPVASVNEIRLNESRPNTSKMIHKPYRRGPLEKSHEKNEKPQDMNKMDATGILKYTEMHWPPKHGAREKMPSPDTGIREASTSGKGATQATTRN